MEQAAAPMMTRRGFLGVLLAAPVAALAATRLKVEPKGFYPQVDGAGQTGALLQTDGWPAGYTLHPGDIFTIANTQIIHPSTELPVGRAKSFVVTANVVADERGRAELPILPPILPRGRFYANILEPPYNDALLVRGFDMPQNLREARWPNP